MGVSEPHIEQVTKLHETAQDSMSVRQEAFTIRTGKGIKQGCKLAPLLWAALTMLITDRYQAACGQEALGKITIFARDNLLHLRFRGPDGFQTPIQKCNYQDILSDLGLTVNPEESQALLRLTGFGSSAARARHAASC